MKTPKFFELIGSSKGESSDPRFRVFVELADKDKDFWESRGTAKERRADRYQPMRRRKLRG